MSEAKLSNKKDMSVAEIEACRDDDDFMAMSTKNVQRLIKSPALVGVRRMAQESFISSSLQKSRKAAKE